MCVKTNIDFQTKYCKTMHRILLLRVRVYVCACACCWTWYSGRASAYATVDRRIDPTCSNQCFTAGVTKAMVYHVCWMVLSYFSFKLVLHNWCNKDRDLCYPDCGMVHIKEPLLLIGFLSRYLSGPLPCV